MKNIDEAVRAPGGPALRVVEGLGRDSASTVVLLYGEHDHASRSALAMSLGPLRGHVIVDLSLCTFVDSGIIGVLLAKYAESRHHGEVFELIVPGENTAVTRIVGQLGLAELMSVSTTPRASLRPAI